MTLARSNCYQALRRVVPFVLATLDTVAVLHSGVPELRHDWRVPVGGNSIEPWLCGFYEGWNSIGIGTPQPYPTFYLAGFLFWPFHSIVSSFTIVATIVFVSIACAASAAFELADPDLRNAPLGCALACFVALNPWVFSKFVAGHIFMVADYAVVLALLAETSRSRPRAWRLVVYSALTILQIEFFLIAIVPLVVWCCRERAYRALTAVLVAAAPIGYGLVASYVHVRSTPFNLTWESSQSVSPLGAVVLTGTAPGYAAAFDLVLFAPAAFALAAAISLVAVRRRFEAICAAIAVASLVLAMGTKGPIAPLYAWSVEHVTETGVFRELYDLIGVVAIGYAAVIARAFRSRLLPSALLAIAGAALAIPWIVTPPTRFFVPEPDVPRAAIPGTPNERVALFPAFQPLSLGREGSGVDPDAYVRSDHAVPINEAMPDYPESAALGAALFRGDVRNLGGLGVTRVVSRPSFRTRYDALRFQWLYADRARPLNPPSHAIDGRPLLTLLPHGAGEATIANQPSGDAVFFGDETGGGRGFEPTRATLDPAVAWVDARLAFPVRPEWATAFGGVTTSGRGSLALPPLAAGTSLLAAADGTLFDDRGRRVTRGPGLHWWPLAADDRSVRCLGTCLVVLRATPPAHLPEQRAAAVAVPIDVRFMRPWLAVATLPPRRGGTLRLNVRFNAAWAAFDGRRFLTHQRIETAVNGWHVDASSKPRTVIFVEEVACVQFVLEAFAAACIVLLIVHAASANGRERSGAGPALAASK